jgi:prepilin-type N-terminal cleavage/methylation domain-containing protein/prepilin-type processing-associated H-X9-DG protein
MYPATSTSRRFTNAFTIIELLVVIGIIGVLIAILLPTLRTVRLRSQQVVCSSNLRQLHTFMVMYCNNNKGYMFPVQADGPDADTSADTLGTNVMPHLRWPAIMFNIRAQQLPYPDDAAAYTAAENAANSGGQGAIIAHLAAYPAAPFTPPVLRCPSDIDPYDAHSYVVNQQMVQLDNPVRFSSGDKAGRTDSDIITAGEKRSVIRDYHMERGAPTTVPDPVTGLLYPSDFDRVIEPYRHSISYGSNFLFLDGHVSTVMPAPAKAGYDPWTVGVPTP